MEKNYKQQIERLKNWSKDWQSDSIAIIEDLSLATEQEKLIKQSLSTKYDIGNCSNCGSDIYFPMLKTKTYEFECYCGAVNRFLFEDGWMRVN